MNVLVAGPVKLGAKYPTGKVPALQAAPDGGGGGGGGVGVGGFVEGGGVGGGVGPGVGCEFGEGFGLGDGEAFGGLGESVGSTSAGSVAGLDGALVDGGLAVDDVEPGFETAAGLLDLACRAALATQVTVVHLPSMRVTWVVAAGMKRTGQAIPSVTARSLRRIDIS